MKQQIGQGITMRLCAVLVLSVFFTVCSADETQSQIKENIKDVVEGVFYSQEEMGEKIKDLLDKRKEKLEVPDFESDFEDLFEHLESLAVRMPSDFTFNMAQFGPKEGHPAFQNQRAMKCFGDKIQFSQFLRRVHEILKDVRDDSSENTMDSADNDDDNSKQNDTSADLDHDDSSNNDTSDETDAKKQTSKGGNSDEILPRRKRDTKVAGFELDDLFEKMEDDDIECLSGFVGEGHEKFLCIHFTHRSAGIFAKILAAGTKCEDYLDDDDDSLGESYQISILNQLRAAKGVNGWTESDVKKVLRLAPDVIDDDFFEDLPQSLFEQYIPQFTQLALRHNGNSRLRYILREKLDDDLSKLTPERLRQIGAGLRSLSFGQIQTLDGKLLLETNVKIFDEDDDDEDDDDDDDSKEKNIPKKVKVINDDDDEDDDDDDDDDDVRRALGYRMKEALKNQEITRAQIGRAMKFLHDDLDFVKSIEPDDLLEALEDIRDVDYDDDDARAVFFHLSQSSHFPQISQLTGRNLTGMGHLLRGMGLAEIAMLNKKAIEDALDDIKDIDFDDSQAQGILEDILDDDEVENLGTADVRKLGKLIKGMPTGQLQKLKAEVVDDLLDDLDDIDLSDAQKRVIVGMARHNEKFSAKFLGLNKFSSVISVADLDDLDDDDVKIHINVSSHIAWRLPQAVVLARTYKQSLAGKLQPANLAVMGHVAKGLLPDDLDDLVETEDDLLDVADSLKDIHDDLTSGQIDELAEQFSDLTDLMNKEVEIDDLKAFRGADIFAYLQAEQFSKLIFTQTGKAAFISQLAKMSTQKMSREHIQYLATLMLKMIDETEADDSKEINSDIRESRRLRSLGQMVLGLTAEQIKTFSGQAIVDNLAILRNLPLTKDQASAILDKLDDFDKKWHCRPDMMARLGSLLLHDDNPLSDECDWDEQKGLLGSFGAIMKGLEKRNEIIKERLEEGFSREEIDMDDDDEGKKRLVNAMVLLATQTTKPNVRRRRATTESITCDMLMRLKSSASQVDQHVLTSMKDDQFINCLSTIGAISDWSKETLNALATKTKLVLKKDVDAWTNEVIRRAGSIIAGLTPAEIQILQLTGVDAMNSIGRHGRLTNEQLKAGFQRWLTLSGKPSVTHVTPSEFSALSEFVCGLDVLDISKINATSFKLSLDVIGRSTSCTPQQREAYLNKAMEVYGNNVSKWDDAVVGDLGHLIAGLSGEHIKMLTNRQLALVTPKVIQNLPNEGVSSLSVIQLTSLSTNQANAVTEAQYLALTNDQKKVLDAKASVNFNKDSTTQTTDTKGGHNAVSALTCSIFLMMSTLMSSLL